MLFFSENMVHFCKYLHFCFIFIIGRYKKNKNYIIIKENHSSHVNLCLLCTWEKNVAAHQNHINIWEVSESVSPLGFGVSEVKSD